MPTCADEQKTQSEAKDDGDVCSAGFWPDDDARWKIKRPRTVSQFILRGTGMSAPRFMVIHPVVVIFVWGRLKGTQTGTMGNVMGSSWPLRFILWGPWMYKHNFMAVHWSTIQAGQHYHHFVHLKRGKLQNEPQRRDGHAIYILRVERSGNSIQ